MYLCPVFKELHLNQEQMGSGLSATDKIGKLEIIERLTNALLVLVNGIC